MDDFELMQKEFVLYFHTWQLFHYCYKCIIANEFYRSLQEQICFLCLFLTMSIALLFE